MDGDADNYDISVDDAFVQRPPSVPNGIRHIWCSGSDDFNQKVLLEMAMLVLVMVMKVMMMHSANARISS